MGPLTTTLLPLTNHFDSGGNLDRLITDTRHGDLLSFYLPSELPDVSDDLAADVVLASIAVGHDAMAGGNNGGTKIGLGLSAASAQHCAAPSAPTSTGNTSAASPQNINSHAEADFCAQAAAEVCGKAHVLWEFSET